MPFSSAPAVQQQSAQDSRLEGSGKKPKKDKQKKESKEKKHKKHKKEKKSKEGGLLSLSLLMQIGTPALLLLLILQLISHTLHPLKSFAARSCRV